MEVVVGGWDITGGLLDHGKVGIKKVDNINIHSLSRINRAMPCKR
jgi:hypothetical protein